MTCDCRSYNWQIGTVPEVVLRAPTWAAPKETICVDACIVETIKHLWDCGFVTLGSCCGHNRDVPTLVIPSSADAQDYYDAIRRIAGDTRPWVIKQWQLIDCPDVVVL